MSQTTMRVQIGCAGQTRTLRRNAASLIRGTTPRRPSLCARRTRVRSPLVTQAIFKRGKKAAEEEEEEDEEEFEAPETKTKFLGGLFGNKSGTQRLKAGQQTEPEESPSKSKSAPKTGGFLQTARIGRKEQNTVFVAGATGRLGLRIVRELLLAGFKVRAGARDTEKAQTYADVATSLGLLPNDAAKRLQVVPVDLEDPDSISAAIGNATRVVQAIGAAENNVLDFGAPKRIDGQAAIDLVDASVEKGITQYVMVTSLGTGKFGWPASALNLFGGILIQKRKAEKALENSGLNYTIVRPGGMEKPGDDYKKTNNVRLSTADKLFGGQVSRLQVAELITSAIANPDLAGGKILEVVAESNAPKLDYETLLQNYGSSGVVQESEEEEEEEEAVVEAPPKAAAKPARPAPRQKRQRTPSSPPSLPEEQEGIAEGIAQKEIDLKLKKDAPEPSDESKNIAEDIAKAEINIDSGKENPVKSWFGGLKKSKESSPEPAASTSQAEPEVTSTSSQEPSDPVTAAKEAVESAKSFVTKEPQSPEEVQRLRNARVKSAETRARQEAEFLARLESQRQEEAQKKKSALEKREKEALEKSRKERDALFAKQEKEAEEFRKIQAQQKEAAQAQRAAQAKALADTQKAEAEKKEASKPVAETPAVAASDPKQAAANNAKEARQWIDAWRSSQGSSTSAAASNGSKPDAEAPKAEASSEAADPSSAVKEARQWIEDWKSRTGAKV